MKKYGLLNILTGALLLGVGAFSNAQAEDGKSIGNTPKAVVELFTSQGCSSCPSADRLLGKLKAEGDLLLLAWHVDYWDYIGWKDTFASPEFTQRQRDYARSLRERSIYTPQAVVNGYGHAVGSSRSRIENIITKSASAGAKLDVPINVKQQGSNYLINIDQAKRDKNLQVFAVFYKDQAKVKITRGENRGETLTYNNIVVGAKNLGKLQSGNFKGQISKADLKSNNADAVAILVQDYSTGNMPKNIHGAKIIR